MIDRNRQVPTIIESRIFSGNLRLYSALFGKWNEQILKPLEPFVAVTRAHWNWSAWVHLALSKKNLIGSYKRTRLARLLCHKGKISVQKQKLVLVLDWHANRLSSLLDGWDAARNEERLYMQVSLGFAGRCHLAAEGTHNPERATPILGLCHGVFADQFILWHILGHFFSRK